MPGSKFLGVHNKASYAIAFALSSCAMSAAKQEIVWDTHSQQRSVVYVGVVGVRQEGKQVALALPLPTVIATRCLHQRLVFVSSFSQLANERRGVGRST